MPNRTWTRMVQLQLLALPTLLTSALVQDLAEGLQLLLVEDGGLGVLVPQGSPCFF